MNDVAEVDLEDLWACASPEALQRTTDLARRVLKAPVSMVSSFSDQHQILRSTSGFEHLAGSLPLSGDVCRRIFETGQSLIVPDVSLEKSVTMPKDVVAYIGAPLRLSSGHDIGTLCVMDLQTHDWSTDDLELIVELAAFLTSQIELKLEIMLREKAEEALGTTKARLLAVADRIPGLVFERRKVEAGRSEYTFFGSSKTTLPSVRQMMEEGSSGALSFIHRDDRDFFRAALLRSTIEETDLDLTFRVKDFDGAIRWLRSQSIVRRDSDGSVYWDGLCFDISDLVAAREDADAAKVARDAIIVNVNHELRTPLQAIIGFTDFLKTETQPELVSAHARNIQAAAESLLAIVNQSLNQAEYGTSSFPEPFDLKSFAETCLSMVGPASVAKSLATRMEIDPSLPGEVTLDLQAVKQAVLNLLNNAVKFTDEGGITLRLARAANRLRISVSDTGIGIPEERRGLLFHRFSRVGPMDRPSQGSGLGLSITKGLIEGMGGQIGVEGHVDRGTTFWFEVPFSSPVPVGTALEVREPERSSTKTAHSGARILLADDLDLNRKLIADMLGTDGHVVDCVMDGAAAVKAASERRYDIILMDMIMPGMDGIAATRAIRKLPAPACDVPILALTANSFKEQLDSCLTAGMNAALTKPMSLEALTSAVSDWTRGRNKAA